MVIHYQDQHYDRLKNACCRQSRVFEDPNFPANDRSLYYSQSPPRVVEWTRPQDLVRAPSLFSASGISPHDLQQGSLGNCWFVAAASCLAKDPSIWKKVIPSPKEQEWPSPGGAPHCGIFRFRFWRFGRWVEVVIDDRLPTSGGELIFCRPGRKSDAFWCSLLEKAYANHHQVSLWRRSSLAAWSQAMPTVLLQSKASPFTQGSCPFFGLTNCASSACAILGGVENGRGPGATDQKNGRK